MSKHTDINVLLSVFWGGSAIHPCRFWMERVPSLDNPADCLTKPGIDRSQVAGAVDESSRVNWTASSEVLEKMLPRGALSDWEEIVAFHIKVAAAIVTAPTNKLFQVH